MGNHDHIAAFILDDHDMVVTEVGSRTLLVLQGDNGIDITVDPIAVANAILDTVDMPEHIHDVCCEQGEVLEVKMTRWRGIEGVAAFESMHIRVLSGSRSAEDFAVGEELDRLFAWANSTIADHMVARNLGLLD